MQPISQQAQKQRRALELIGEILALEGEPRRAYIDRICAGDDELRREIEKWLEVSSATLDRVFASPVLEQEGPVAMDAPTLAMGDFEPRHGTLPERLGPYRILDSLGRGGMGTVYLAEQQHPVERRVALKVINAFSDAQRAERFALECQALARLSHPHIASLFEVGSTEADQPFVAMELIEGDTITAWCDRHRLSLRRRIELFMGVCAGVRHAHEKGIIHRDLKPSNILVTEIDGEPMAKVIDFGIARAMDNPLLEPGKRLTLADQMIGSPIYMSPETILGERDADTRSDVHALGLILYELVCGALPFDPDAETLAVLLHQISTTDLPPPSRRFAALEPASRQAIAEQRQLREGELRRRLQGDLDAIVAKAIVRDRDERYGSPADLATDLRCLLEKRPVSARAPVPAYLLLRYLQRHLGFVVAASALVITLLAGIVVSTREARRANLEAERAMQAVEQARTEERRARLAQSEAQQVSQFLVDLFEISDPERARETPVDARQLFDRGVRKLRTELHDQPLARARLLSTVCDIYTKMALLGEAESLAREALELRQSRLEPTDDDLLRSVNQLGVIYRRQGRYEESEPLLRRVVEARQAAEPAEPEALAQALNNLGNLYWNQGRQQEALETHGRALEIRESLPELESQILAESLNNLGVLHLELERFEEAEVYFKRAAMIFSESLGPEHPRRAACLNNLGLIEHRLRKWRQAENHLREAARIWGQAYGEGHPRTLMARTNLARLWVTMGRDRESVELWRGMLEDQEAGTAISQVRIASTLRSLGLALGRLGEFDSARSALERSLAIYRQERGDQHASTIRGRSNLAWLAVRRGDFAEAEKLNRRLLELRRQRWGEDSESVASSSFLLAQALAGQGRHGEAESLLRRALEIRDKALGEHEEVADVLLELGELLAASGRPLQARPSLERAIAIYDKTLPSSHPQARRARQALEQLERSTPGS